MASRVVLMCGLSGSGKRTYVLTVTDQGFRRLSIDEYVFDLYGTSGIDFDETTCVGKGETCIETSRPLSDRIGELPI